jgi:hypothetical protein
VARRVRPRPAPPDAAQRIAWVIDTAWKAFQMKVSGMRERWPELSEQDVRRIALEGAIANNPWQPGRQRRRA